MVKIERVKTFAKNVIRKKLKRIRPSSLHIKLISRFKLNISQFKINRLGTKEATHAQRWWITADTRVQILTKIPAKKDLTHVA